MASYLGFIVILALCLLGLVGVKAYSIEDFKKVQSEVFGEKTEFLSWERASKVIERMIELIKSGEIPPEVQGQQNLHYLSSLQDICKFHESKLDEDLSKLEFIEKSFSQAPNLKEYLMVCRQRICLRNSPAAYERVLKNLKVDGETDKIVTTLASEVEFTFRPPPRRVYAIKDIFVYDFHEIVLRTLRQLDPQGAKKIADKLINKDKSLRKFMDKVRSSCVTFSEQIDPLVELWPSRHPRYESTNEFDKLTTLHFTLKICKKVVNDWESIVAASLKDAKEHLVLHKRQTPHYHYSPESN